ncbi:MAG: class I SAM-dependent methyltransferase [Anaerolineae bacterium]
MLSLARQERLRARYKAATPGYHTSGELYEGLLRRHIKPDSRILDAGCGQAGIVARARGQALAAGIDITFAGFRDAVDLSDLVCGDLAHLPFADGAFTIVASSWVFEHLEHPGRVFAEFARVLQPGGMLIFLTPNANNWVTLANRLAPSRLQKGLVRALYGREEVFTFRTCYRANTRAALDRHLNAAGFACAELHCVGDPTYLAFGELGYKLGVLLERLTDRGGLRELKVHWVGAYVKRETEDVKREHA